MMTTFAFKPKLLTTLRHYNKQQFTTDLLAGIIVGIVALPLAIAFGIASGVTPEKGIITAIVAGLIVSVLGGSKVQIGGPTGAFIIIIYGIIQQYGFEGLTIATLMAGVFLIMFGVLHLCTIIKYIPYPIVVGFTSGIALTIFTTQTYNGDRAKRLYREVGGIYRLIWYYRPVERRCGYWLCGCDCRMAYDCQI